MSKRELIRDVEAALRISQLSPSLTGEEVEVIRNTSLFALSILESLEDVKVAMERYRLEAYEAGHFGNPDCRNVGYLTSEEGWDDRIRITNWIVALMCPQG